MENIISWIGAFAHSKHIPNISSTYFVQTYIQLIYTNIYKLYKTIPFSNKSEINVD